MTRKLDPLLPALRALEAHASDMHRQQQLAEQKLQTELQELEALRSKASLGATALGVRQQLGVDGAWQGWLLQRRAHINQELALSRVRYASTLQAVQLAFARRSQVEAFSEEERAQKAKTRIAKQQVMTDQLVLMKQFQRLR